MIFPLPTYFFPVNKKITLLDDIILQHKEQTFLSRCPSSRNNYQDQKCQLMWWIHWFPSTPSPPQTHRDVKKVSASKPVLETFQTPFIRKSNAGCSERHQSTASAREPFEAAQRSLFWTAAWHGGQKPLTGPAAWTRTQPLQALLKRWFILTEQTWIKIQSRFKDMFTKEVIVFL